MVKEHNSMGEYAPFKGDITSRTRGTIVVFEVGNINHIWTIQCPIKRRIINRPGAYEGMVVVSTQEMKRNNKCM